MNEDNIVLVEQMLDVGSERGEHSLILCQCYSTFEEASAAAFADAKAWVVVTPTNRPKCGLISGASYRSRTGPKLFTRRGFGSRWILWI